MAADSVAVNQPAATPTTTDDDRAGRPDGLAQLMDQVLDAELVAAGVVVS